VFEQHRARVAVTVVGPVRRAVNNLAALVNQKGVAVGEHGTLPLFEQRDAGGEEAGQPQVVRAEVCEVRPARLRQPLVERGAQAAVLARDQLSSEGAVPQQLLDDAH